MTLLRRASSPGLVRLAALSLAASGLLALTALLGCPEEILEGGLGGALGTALWLSEGALPGWAAASAVA